MFENNYYGEKEGSERAAAVVTEDTDLDETEPTEKKLKNIQWRQIGHDI